MPTIDDLCQTRSLSDADEVALYIRDQGGTRKATLGQLADYMQGAFEGEPDETVYSLAADDNAFTVAVLPATPGASVWSQIAPPAGLVAGTIFLPGADDRANGQEVLVTSTQVIAALTVNGSGAALSGAPAAISPTTPFRLRFDSISSTWYRIG